MVKKVLFVLLFSVPLLAESAFEKHCVTCHAEKGIDLQEMYMSYLKMYGGKENMKVSLKHYFKYPLRDIALHKELIRDKFSIKKALEIPNEELDEAIEAFWNHYTVIGKLR